MYKRQGHHRVALPQLTNLEATAIEVHGALGGVLVVSAYKPPQAELLVGDRNVIFDSHRRVILAGDLNCKHRVWNSRLTTQNGRRLLSFVESRRAMVFGPAQPTFFPSRPNAAPDVPDIAVTQGAVSYTHLDVYKRQT